MELPAMYSLLSPKERQEVREQYRIIQNDKCMFCNGDLTETPPVSVTSKKINWKLFPPNFLKYPIHLQHCHTTGLTEGAIHAYCNAVLWQYYGK